ncbi:hypothetical protein GGX14DRAFT_598528 [Mycena pura]|uniref:BAG domain-containing protein n=1 Tax=Mycena pura TaxID=153505 RepID=A0AAD6VPB9_9AGAR|nr:hypothetical protein GGX14DRAFT_598528 [Mycena pura]
MVHLKWNHERQVLFYSLHSCLSSVSRFSFQLPAPETPLRAVRDAVANLTHLPPDGFKLIHKGAVMKDDNASVSAYHMRESSTIAVVEIGPPPAQPQETPSAKQPPKQKAAAHVRSEQSVISTIHSELVNVRSELLPAVDHLLAAPAAPQSSKPKEHIRLSELLLQSLLRLDAIVTDGEWEAARRERKAAVKEVQGLLDRLDSSRD